MSTTVLDRDGRLLRAFTTTDGRWRLPVATADVDPRYLDMLIAYEDGRFRSHAGVDPLAVVRAAGQLISSGRIVSGASTLTMQVARLVGEPEPRTIMAKLRQAGLALALERRLSKDEILALYLRLAPFGGNLEGVRAASLAYFGKEPRRLSVGERALLVAIPQSPAARRPDRDAKAARRARDRVLARAVAAGTITRAEADEARREPVPTARRPFPQLAPHLAEAEVVRAPSVRVHRLSVDRDRQSALETLAREHAARIGPRQSVAILAVHHQTGEIIAYVGSAGHLDEGRLGANDMTAAVRSPGSTLKPFIYGLAFERGLAHPETLIEDRPARFGRYAPSNFDEDFHGTVSVRQALALSLNIPAVKVLAEVGPKRLVGRIRRAGVMPRLPDNAEPSLAVALGGLGLTLRELTQLYVALARGGDAVPLVHHLSAPSSTGERPCRSSPGCRQPNARVLSRAAAWHVADALKDAPPPGSARGQRIAFKTGTSYGYRDAWAAGFDGRYTVAVWVGRADGTPSPGLTGHSAAAPLLFDAFGRLAERTQPLASAPPGVLRLRNSDLPPTLRRFNESGGNATATGEPAVVIAFPPDKAELEADAGGEDIVLKAEGGALPLTWLVDGTPVATEPGSREATWTPRGVGFAQISVVDAEGRADRVTIRLRWMQ
ncbi:MAG: penicillin-binding protein 1C [Hyphomicrobiaceae bacterium]|nr:penicillin-binding protein 1C [Hyphomicrobiaceae bacterium]